MDLQRITSHPVHLVDDEGNFNPTALVPFCSISDNFSVMGVKIDQFDVPICNSFRPKIVRDQLCYTVDLNKFRQRNKFKERISFTFYIDYNEDREFSNTYDRRNNPEYAVRAKNGVIIESIGIDIFSNPTLHFCTKISEPLLLELENEYNFNVIKEIRASESFLSMDAHVRKCQNDETFGECLTKNYINNLKKKCNCLPFNIRLTDKVMKMLMTKITISKLYDLVY